MPEPQQIYVGTLSRRERSWGRPRRRTARFHALAAGLCAAVATVAVVAGALGHFFP